jgi:YbbR domain-containing protein
MRRLTNNLGIKAGSLVLATMLSAYVYLYLNFPTTQALFVPLVIHNLDPGLIIVSRAPESDRVLLRVRGPYRSIRQLAAIRYSATLDLSELKEPGTMPVRVHVPELNQLIVTDQDPQLVSVAVEKLAAKKLKLTIDRRGKQAPGQVVASEDVSNTEVNIAGPESVVSRVQLARIEPDVEGATEDVVSTEQVQLYDAMRLPISKAGLTVNPAAVRYSLELIPVGDTRLLAVVPDYAGKPPRQYVLAGLTAKPAYIPVKAGLVPSGVISVRTAPVDLAKARASFTATVDLMYPFQTPAAADLPKQCQVYVEITPLPENGAGAERLTIQLVHSDKRYEYVLSPPELLLRLDGATKLDQTDQQLLRAFVDAEGLTPGEHRVVPQVALPLGLEHVTIIPGSVKLTIIERGK